MRNPKEITLNGKTLDVILEEHQHWLDKDINGWSHMCANLRDADLQSSDLRDADLRGADLCSANLRDADLRGSNLCDAKLSFVDLRGSILRGVNLCDSDLRGANLRGSDLCGSILYHTNLRNSDLCGANLYHTDLLDADLCGANLRGANLRDADLSGAKGDLIEYRRGKILTETIKGYKRCKYGVIVTLEIPRGAIVFSINGNKCRTNKAKVVEIDGADRAYSTRNYMSYYVGDEFTIYNFNCEYNKECSQGIHFFMTREEAENYN